MGNFRELVVWKDAKQLAVQVYRLTRQFPPEERFGLTSQLRRMGSWYGRSKPLRMPSPAG